MTAPTMTEILMRQQSVFLLDRNLKAAGIDAESVTFGEAGLIVTYAANETAQNIAAGEAIEAAFDLEAERAAIDAAKADATFSRQNIIERADEILAQEAAGQTAATADIATIATGVTATNAATTLAHMKPIVLGILSVMDREIKRSKDHMQATADVVKLVRHLAEG